MAVKKKQKIKCGEFPSVKDCENFTGNEISVLQYIIVYSKFL